MINPEYIAFFGLFVGVLVRMYLPYLRKLYQGATVSFDNKYLVSGLAGLVLALIVVFMIGPEMLIVEVAEEEMATSFLKIFWLNWMVGFASSAVVNEVLAWGATPKEV